VFSSQEKESEKFFFNFDVKDFASPPNDFNAFVALSKFPLNASQILTFSHISTSAILPSSANFGSSLFIVFIRSFIFHIAKLIAHLKDTFILFAIAPNHQDTVFCSHCAVQIIKSKELTTNPARASNQFFMFHIVNWKILAIVCNHKARTLNASFQVPVKTDVVFSDSNHTKANRSAKALVIVFIKPIEVFTIVHIAPTRAFTVLAIACKALSSNWSIILLVVSNAVLNSEEIIAPNSDNFVCSESTRFEYLPCSVFACSSKAPPNLSFNQVNIACMPSLAVIPAFHRLPSSFFVSQSCSSNISNTGNHLSASCKTSSADTLPFACICQRAVITQERVSLFPQTAATPSPSASSVGNACSAVNQNQRSFFVASVIFSLLNGVLAAKSSICCNNLFASATDQVSVVNAALADSICDVKEKTLFVKSIILSIAKTEAIIPHNLPIHFPSQSNFLCNLLVVSSPVFLKFCSLLFASFLRLRVACTTSNSSFCFFAGSKSFFVSLAYSFAWDLAFLSSSSNHIEILDIFSYRC